MNSYAGTIPIVVGVTGHRDLREQDISALKEAVAGELASLRKRYPHSDVVVMTSLAEGADQLCAETALEMGLGIISVLPMPIEEYAEDFEGKPLAKLYELAGKSSQTFVSKWTEPFEEGRDYLYRQAGFYVSGHSHILMALWNGAEGDSRGCGTYAAVDIALRNRSHGAAGEQLRHANGTVIQIVTPRRRSGETDLRAGEVIMHGDTAICDKILKDTDIYNKDCLALTRESSDQETGEEEAACPQTGTDAGSQENGEPAGGGTQGDRPVCVSPQEIEDDAGSREKCEPAGSSQQADADTDRAGSKLEAVYAASDKLSVINAVRHRRELVILSVSATVLAMAFLLYDEIDWQGMILLCGAMIIVLFAINAYTGRSKAHARYIEYRILAEACRVQTYLDTAGCPRKVTDIMPWNLQVTIPWVGKALSAALIGREPGEKSSILDAWITDQKNYHSRALKRTEVQLARNDRIVRIALIFTLLIYLIALIFEIVCCGMFGGDNFFSDAVNDYVRTGIKVAMGTFSAGTLFANNYYGSQALPNVIDDHRKMVLLYEEAEREISEKGEAEPLLMRLAEDELSENANWYAYQSKHEPDFGI